MGKKVVAIYGSHRKNGNSNYIMDTLLGAIPGEDVEIQKYYLNKMDIKHCTGCFHCRADGVCMHKDDMPGLLEAIMAADKVVLSIPVFMFQASGTVKQFMDRCYPLLEGVNGQYTRRMTPKDTVLVYSQGAPVPQAFQPYMDMNKTSFCMMGLNVVETIVCTTSNEIGAAKENTELCERAAKVGNSLFAE